MRAGKRMAAALHAEWIVVYVETPDLLRLPEAERNQRIALAAPGRIAGRRNGDARRPSAGAELAHYAQTRNVTRILHRRPSRKGLARWLRPSTYGELLAHIRGIDVTVVKATEAMRIAKQPAARAQRGVP